MGKLAILVIIVCLGVVALFAVSNKDVTTINVPFDQTYEIPKIGLMLVSGFLGAAAMLLVFVVRDTKRFVLTQQQQRRRKKEDRIQSLYSRAVNAVLADDEREARNALDGVIKEEADHVGAHLRLGDLEARAGRHEAAVEHYKRALSASPRDLEALFSLEEVYESMGRFEDALAQAERILEADPGSMSGLHRKRAVLEKLGRWDDLVDAQKTLLKFKLDEESRSQEQAALLGYRYELARRSMERGEPEKAGKIFRSLARDNPAFVPAHLGVAEVMLGEGASEEAAGYLEKAYEQTSSLVVLARLEDLLISLGEPGRLIRVYQRSISVRPQDQFLRFFLGKLYYRLEMIDDAFETLAALELPEPSADYHRLMGELHMRRNQCERAVEEFRKMPELARSLRLPYSCTFCGLTEMEWSGRCPRCGRWDSLRMDLHGSREG